MVLYCYTDRKGASYCMCTDDFKLLIGPLLRTVVCNVLYSMSHQLSFSLSFVVTTVLIPHLIRHYHPPHVHVFFFGEDCRPSERRTRTVLLYKGKWYISEATSMIVASIASGPLMVISKVGGTSRRSRGRMFGLPPKRLASSTIVVPLR
jgi:hypothetical protein